MFDKKHIMIGGISIPVAVLIGTIAWATNTVSEVKVERGNIKRNATGIEEGRSERKEIKKELTAARRDLDKVIVHQEHMMQDLKRTFEDMRESDKEQKEMNTALMLLMTKIANGNH